MDVASSEFWNDDAKHYELTKSGEGKKSSDEMIALYDDWIRQYPIVSIEDGLAEGDWPGWQRLTQALGSKIQLVGDDIFVTNPSILRRGIDEKIGNALLVKLNQIGTVTETLDAVEMARQAGYASVMRRSLGLSLLLITHDLSIVANLADTVAVMNAGRIVEHSPVRRLFAAPAHPYTRHLLACASL